MAVMLSTNLRTGVLSCACAVDVCPLNGRVDCVDKYWIDLLSPQ